jgi:hypothetical protein
MVEVSSTLSPARRLPEPDKEDRMAYYHEQHLADFGKIAEGRPALGKKFSDYYGAGFADGALSAR